MEGACKYCASKEATIERESIFVNHNNDIVSLDYDNRIEVLTDYAWLLIDINYCPMCGRKLKED